jgi:hypothetical protein
MHPNLETYEDCILSGALPHEDLLEVVLQVLRFLLRDLTHSMVEVVLDEFPPDILPS